MKSVSYQISLTLKIYQYEEEGVAELGIEEGGVEEEMLERRLSERVLNAWREFFRSFPN